MLQTTFYLSVNRGSDTLTMDGDLSLFKELLTALNTTTHKLPDSCSAATKAAEGLKTGTICHRAADTNPAGGQGEL